MMGQEGSDICMIFLYRLPLSDSLKDALVSLVLALKFWVWKCIVLLFLLWQCPQDDVVSICYNGSYCCMCRVCGIRSSPYLAVPQYKGAEYTGHVCCPAKCDWVFIAVSGTPSPQPHSLWISIGVASSNRSWRLLDANISQGDRQIQAKTALSIILSHIYPLDLDSEETYTLHKYFFADIILWETIITSSWYKFISYICTVNVEIFTLYIISTYFTFVEYPWK